MLPALPEATTSELQKENERLYGVLEINAVLSATLKLEEVLDALLKKAKDVCEAEASSLMLLDNLTEELYFYTISEQKSSSLKNVRLKFGEGIAGWVAQNKKPVLVEDCSKDSRFSKKADDKSQFETRTMMCVPLILRQETLGTIQVLNRLDEEPFCDSDLRIFLVLANQAAVAIKNARLYEMATIDGMTRLYLKDYFLNCLEEEYQNAKNSSKPMSLLMSDIDFFKKVNDLYGHQGGDKALVFLAKIIQKTVASLKETGNSSIAGRYGGEEFCVLLPGKDEKEAKEIGELIRKNIEESVICIEEKSAKITISIGLASYPVHSNYIDTSLDFIKLADEALYTCKARGRNCVSSYENQ